MFRTESDVDPDAAERGGIDAQPKADSKKADPDDDSDP